MFLFSILFNQLDQLDQFDHLVSRIMPRFQAQRFASPFKIIPISLPLPLPQSIELFQVFPGYAAVVNNQHILIVGVSGVLGRVEGTGDYDL